MLRKSDQWYQAMTQEAIAEGRQPGDNPFRFNIDDEENLLEESQHAMGVSPHIAIALVTGEWK